MKEKLKHFSLLTASTLIMAVGTYFFKFTIHVRPDFCRNRTAWTYIIMLLPAEKEKCQRYRIDYRCHRIRHSFIITWNRIEKEHDRNERLVEKRCCISDLSEKL